MAMQKILQIKDLAIGFSKKKPLVENIDVNGREGELVALIGKNGIGKSTLLKTLVSLIRPIDGQIFLEGREIRTYPARELAVKMGFVSTEIIRTGNLRVMDLVALGRFPHTNWIGRLNGEDRDKVMDAVTKVGLEGLEFKFISEISDGERQRAMVARTLAQDTRLIILDEPTAFLDLPGRHEMLHLLGELSRKEGKTVIFSSHDLNMVMSEADKIWMMVKDGMIQGSPEDLALDGSFDRLFSESRATFDLKSGSFVFPGYFYGKVILTGEGTEFFWTRTALTRAGFEVVADHKVKIPEIMVEGNEDQRRWNLHPVEGEDRVFLTLYNLVNYLRE